MFLVHEAFTIIFVCRNVDESADVIEGLILDFFRRAFLSNILVEAQGLLRAPYYMPYKFPLKL